MSFFDPFGLEYRYGPGNYQQFMDPGRSGCEQAIWQSGFIVGWKPCDPNQQRSPGAGSTESCPGAEPTDPYGDLKDKWDGYNDVADTNAAQSQQHASDRLNRAADNARACRDQALASVAEGLILDTLYGANLNQWVEAAPRGSTAARVGNVAKKGALVGTLAGMIPTAVIFAQCVEGARKAGGLY